MKNYKEVEMFAKNAPCGSYAAGCPTGYVEESVSFCGPNKYYVWCDGYIAGESKYINVCKNCERTS